MNLKPFAVFSPDAGLVSDMPSILLPVAATPEISDYYFQGGEVKRYKKRIQLFSALPDAVLTQFTLNQASLDRKYFLYFTKRDICYRDRNNDRYVFINKRIDGGLVSAVTELTDGNTQIDFALDTGVDLTDVKAGDFIKLGDTDAMTTDDVWYEILEVLDADSIKIDGVLETGYSVPTGGDDFVIRLTFAGTDEDYWVCAQTGSDIDGSAEQLLATNNAVDYPIYWSGGTDLVEDLTTEFKCRWINYFGGRAIASHIVAGGQIYPVNYRWSGLLDFTDWGGTGSDAGESALTEGQGYITRGLVYRDFLYIIKSESIERLWAVEGDDIFNSKVLRTDLGTKAPHSFVTYRDMVYFYCTIDRTFRRFDGYYDQVISKDQDPTIKNITSAKEPLIQGYFVHDSRQMLWSVPYAGSDTLNKIFIADIDYNKSPWTIIDMEAVSFGRYELGEDVYWEDLDYPDWASWDWSSWTSPEGTEDSAIDCCADSSGYIYQMNASRLDDGAEYTSRIVFETDLTSKKGALPFYKRILKIQFYVRPEGGGTVDVGVKRDHETDFQDAGSFTLIPDREINIIDHPVDYRAKSFQIELESLYNFSLIGFVIWFIPAGDR